MFGTVTQGENSMSLILCRGAGLCDLNFQDEKVLNEWKGVQICKHHEEELLTKWDDVHSGFRHKHVYRRHAGHGYIIACSMPQGLEHNHADHRRPYERLQPLTIKEAQGILKSKGVLVHPGIPLCTTHKTYVEELITKSKSPPAKKQKIETSSIATDSGSENDDGKDTCPLDPLYLPYDNRVPPIKKSLMDFAAALGISRVCSVTPWDKMKQATRERKASAARKLIIGMLQLMVPDKTEEFKKMVEHKFVEIDEWTSGSSAELDIIMEQIAAQYFSAEDRNNQILILSLVANSVSYLKVEKYIPGLSGYMYDRAKKFSRRKRSTVLPKDTTTLVKYKREAVEAFIEFITSPTVMIGLPYGVRKVKDSDGAKIEIPNSIRQQSATEIIEMYKSICEDNNQLDLLLGTSTMFKILNTCAATKREATTCVDYFIATGMESFDGLHQIVDNWNEHSMFDSDVIKQMKQELFQSAQYLRTDFRMHVKNYSRVADHCANFALSDPNDVNLASSCSSGPDKYSHDLLCERCEKVDGILKKLESHATLFVSEKESSDSSSTISLEKLKEDLELIAQYKRNIFEMKKHLLRAAVTNEERQNITKHLKDNEALVTLDFAQKFLPKWHREKQSDYFGKKGISYHVSHVTARIGTVFAQHSFVHIYEGSVTQDSKLIVSTIAHFLKELKKVGIVTVHLRSDNAGAYQRRVKEYINKGNNVQTPLEFFNALKDNPPNGISIFHGTITTTNDGDTEWKGVSNLNHFTLEKDGIRAKRYGHVGVGKFVEYKTFKPVLGTHKFEEAGYLASKINTDAKRKAERDAVQTGSPTEFWYQSKCAKSSKCVHEPDDISPTVQESASENVIGNLFSCPEPGCSSTFLKYWNLEKHILKGQHNIASDRMTERDFALNFFIRKLEDVNPASACPIVGTAVKQMAEAKPEAKLSTGWALPEKKTRKAFGKDVVAFLIECFDQGVVSKKPLNPVVVEKLMRTVKKKDGSKRFSTEEMLSFRQIAGFFSREADKRRHAQQALTTLAPTTQRSHHRRELRRLSRHRRHRKHRRHQPTTAVVEQDDYIESEEDHMDSGWIRFLKLEEFWSVSDEVYNAILDNSHSIFSQEKK